MTFIPKGFSLFDRLFAYFDSLRPSDRFLIKILLIVFVVSGLYSLYQLNESFTSDIPSTGGTLIEGVVGTPRFVNPVIAITRADHDLVALTYSGLLHLSPMGTLENDLAESVTVSDDGLVYNVILRKDRTFHDGTPIRAEDVAFTISLIQNPSLKSPLRGNWSGVTVELVSDYELNFVLEDAYAPFEENLTVGILPKHIWNDLSTEEFPFSQYNTEPVGSGPYELSSIKRSESGLISEYRLKAVGQDDNSANISMVIIRFYQNEEAVVEALKKGEINATAALSERSLRNYDTGEWQVIEYTLPRVFSLFFNQNKSIALRDHAAREALQEAVNRQTLVDRVLEGFGEPTSSPLPKGFIGNDLNEEDQRSDEEHLAAARDILSSAGWEKTEEGFWKKEIDDAETTLDLTIRSANTPVFEQTAAYLVEVWRSLGVDTKVELYEQSDLIQTVIRPRDYQALLFGVDIGRPLDLYPFWHSSQREDPGLNVALYTNITTDKLLEKIRRERDTDVRDEDLLAFTSEISSETPAIFLFSPSFVYVTSHDIHTTDMERLSKPSERFSNIDKWYINEDSVWPLFAQD